MMRDLNFRVLVVFLILTIFLGKGYSNTLKFTLSVQRDTMFIGEPLVVTKMIENLGENKAVIYSPSLWTNILYDDLKLRLYTPMNKSYGYKLGIHCDGPRVPSCTILPSKRVFVREIIWWDNFFRGQEDVKKLPAREYKLLANWCLPNQPFWQFESETCKFYAKPLQGEDLKAYEELRKAGHYIWGWLGSKERKEMYEASGKALNIKSKLFREYALLYRARTTQNEKEGKELRSKLSAEFPNSPLIGSGSQHIYYGDRIKE